MSTLPPLLQVMGNTVTPGRRAVSGSGARGTSRGFPSASTRLASRTTVGWVQLPPRKPWKAPDAVISAMSPAWEELAGWRRTTTASTKGSSRWARSAAIWRRSARMTGQRYAGRGRSLLRLQEQEAVIRHRLVVGGLGVDVAGQASSGRRLAAR